MYMQPFSKKFLAKNGEEIVLRTPLREDLDELIKYANALSQEDTYLILAGEVVTREEEIRYLDQILFEIERANRFHVFAFVKDKLVANADIHRITRFRTRSFHVGEMAISVAKEYRGQGIGREILQILIYESKKMGLQLLILDAFAENVRAIELYKTLGFKISGEHPNFFRYKTRLMGQVLMHLPLA